MAIGIKVVVAIEEIVAVKFGDPTAGWRLGLGSRSLSTLATSRARTRPKTFRFWELSTFFRPRGFHTRPIERGALQVTAHCNQIGLGLAAAASGCCKPLVDLNGGLAVSLPMLHAVELRLRKLNAHAGNERSSDNTKLEPRTRLLTPAPDK